MEIFGNSPERIKTPREKLLDLEKEGKYVFHGSEMSVDELIPMQAENNNEKDGGPAVHASPYADIAIFFALVKKQGAPNGSNVSSGINDDIMHMSATRDLIDIARTKVGKVYVLDKDKFKDFRGTECRSEESVKPIEVIEVSFRDLPPSVQVMD